MTPQTMHIQRLKECFQNVPHVGKNHVLQSDILSSVLGSNLWWQVIGANRSS